ncbi:unnamed protein product [Tilletia caries]|uniref:Uncharacterized protein n=1 Tax=Tilletia controversa TaxID=13291 RepID=A0A8X7SRZ7_9BASI|nr:hypothetical protein A4X06_0g9764 [Tilletia controversa]CAD6888664.1 unnamed protein product [Tilletia caries]
MDALLNCNFSGFVQFDSVTKEASKKHWTIEICFALGVSDDAITSATATLYSPSQPLTEHLYFIKGQFPNSNSPLPGHPA